MNYIRIDKDNTHNLVVTYSIWPFDDALLSDETIGFITSYAFGDYEEAAQNAMTLLKDPSSALCQDSSYITHKEKMEAILSDLERIDGFIINECLCVFDKDLTCIDCPTEYMYDVGQVFKEQDYSESPKEEEKLMS